MGSLEQAIARVVQEVCEHQAAWTGTATELREAVRLVAPALDVSAGEVDEAARRLCQAGRLRLHTVGDYQQPLRLSPALDATRQSREQNISVSGGNVQIGDHNHQAITYGNVLQALIHLIEEQRELPETEREELTSAVQKLLAHPLTQTAIASASSIASALLGRG